MLLLLLQIQTLKADVCAIPCINPPFCVYLNFFGGPNWLKIDAFDPSPTTNLGFFAGASLGAPLGCCSYWLTYTRMEVEYAIRKNQLRTISDGLVTETLFGSASTNSWMVDLYQDIPIPHCYLTPYIGVGAGYSYRNTLSEVVAFTGENDRSNGFAWQVIGGLSIPVNIATLLSVEYRYFVSPQYLHQQDLALTLRYYY